jgi:hypothetical protein
MTERERERNEGDNDRHYIGAEGPQKKVSSVLKVHRQCSLFLLIGVMHMITINSYLNVYGV